MYVICDELNWIELKLLWARSNFQHKDTDPMLIELNWIVEMRSHQSFLFAEESACHGSRLLFAVWYFPAPTLSDPSMFMFIRSQRCTLMWCGVVFCCVVLCDVFRISWGPLITFEIHAMEQHRMELDCALWCDVRISLYCSTFYAIPSWTMQDYVSHLGTAIDKHRKLQCH